MKKIFYFLLFLLCSSRPFAQININGDFECIGYNDEPMKWFIPSTNGHYRFTSDSINPYKSKFSGRITPTEICGKLSSMVCYQQVALPSGKAFRKISVKYHFKINSGVNESISHWIRPNTCPNGKIGVYLIDSTNVKLKGDPKHQQWYEYYAEIFLSKEAYLCERFYVGFMLQGVTDINVDDVEVFIDDKKIIDAPCIPEKRNLPTPNDIKWVEQNSIALLNTFDYSNLKDISKLKKAFGNASIIALGESTH